ncbi:MAG: hypothetical protein Q8L48_44440 [Archangium sp.]|nr:hypothetical protein [Archangium sp.]
MRRLTLLSLTLGVAVVACAPEPPPPELRRDAPIAGAPPHGVPPDITDEDLLDAGPPEVDAGLCCPVHFRLAGQADEARVDLRLVGHPTGLSTTLDAGVWSVTACMVLEQPERYYYSVGISVNDAAQDGGLFMTTRTNPFAPTEFSAEAPLVNVFEPGAVTSCGDLDAGLHAQVL